ncbi:major tail protein [Enterococcus casseliflavus]|uniref:major tail protein n=1 Tax=Enterococcus casseliflavus TaxID=37734 RepID=UPI003D6A9460
MTLVGFKRATIQILDEELKPVADKKYVIEGTTNKGATSAFEITGLSPEAVKAYGSDIPYWVIQEGTGEVAATFSALDLPFEVENEVLGRKKATNGVYHAGEKTKPPYCAILFESATLRGEKMGTGLYAGKFGRESIAGNTKEGSTPTPEADQFTFSPIQKKIGDDNETVGFAVGDESFTALEAELFGGAGE